MAHIKPRCMCNDSENKNESNYLYVSSALHNAIDGRTERQIPLVNLSSTGTVSASIYDGLSGITRYTVDLTFQVYDHDAFETLIDGTIKWDGARFDRDLLTIVTSVRVLDVAAFARFVSVRHRLTAKIWDRNPLMNLAVGEEDADEVVVKEWATPNKPRRSRRQAGSSASEISLSDLNLKTL